jgi:hypothetical protein
MNISTSTYEIYAYGNNKINIPDNTDNSFLFEAIKNATINTQKFIIIIL